MKAPIALLGAAIVGGLAALTALVLPTAALESVVMRSGLPSIIAAAEPPLGFTARFCLALGAGGFSGVMAGLTLFVLFGTNAVDIDLGRGRADSAPEPDAMRAPSLRRADAHPDAPPRPPLMAARDLGTPFLEVGVDQAEIARPLPLTPRKPVEAQAERPLARADLPGAGAPLPLAAVKPVRAAADSGPVEQPLPEDLDQPLAAFDPHALPEVPLSAPVLPPIKPRATVAVVTPEPAPVVAPAPEPAPIVVAVPVIVAAPVPEPVLAEKVPLASPPPERFETFEITPQRQPAATTPYPFAARPRAKVPADEPLARPETDASVNALLERLERGVIRRGGAGAAAFRKDEPALARGEDHGLQDTLASLRSMARRA